MQLLVRYMLLKGSGPWLYHATIGTHIAASCYTDRDDITCLCCSSFHIYHVYIECMCWISRSNFPVKMRYHCLFLAVENIVLVRCNATSKYCKYDIPIKHILDLLVLRLEYSGMTRSIALHHQIILNHGTDHAGWTPRGKMSTACIISMLRNDRK